MSLTIAELERKAFIDPSSVSAAELMPHLQNLMQSEQAAQLGQKTLERRIERLEEQVHFASELVERVKEFAKTLPKTKQATLLALLDGTSFEA
jgi:ABC-type Na+ transport system ATPase subunit NatA